MELTPELQKQITHNIALCDDPLHVPDSVKLTLNPRPDSWLMVEWRGSDGKLKRLYRTRG
jgi:hypothetical protein